MMAKENRERERKIGAEDINRILGIKESFELPERLMEILRNTAGREKVFEEFMTIEADFSFDWFTDYFQESHSNRDNMMQDFTPKALCAMLPEIAGSYRNAADYCAGTGGLTIAAWNRNKSAFYFCVELSKRAFPLLLFNLAIRNMDALAVNQDILSGEIYGIYRLTQGERFSRMETLDRLPELPLFDYVMMNPPYSLKHKWNEKEGDPRFMGYGYPPSQFSDFAFVLHGLYQMKDGGTLCAILPHGVLFRGNKEAAIRRTLIENKLVYAVIGLPEKLFLNTGIPVCVLVLRKAEDTLVIDASKEYRAAAKQNFLEPENTEKILSALRLRASVDKFSYLAGLEEIAENDYNLNIPRYVDTYEPPPPIDIVAVTREIADCNRQIHRTSCELLEFFRDMVGMDDRHDAEMKEVVRIWEGICGEYGEQDGQAD
jgi:Type I restriction-modification system methyltransferase subunit